MRNVPAPRRLLVAGAATLAVLGTATAAQAATVTVTDDAGNPVALAPGAAATIRNMSPSIGIGFTPTTDANYSMSFAGPDGVAAATAVNCFTTKVPVKRGLDYRGNGTYTVSVANFTKADRTCAKATSVQTYQVVIAGSVAIAPPAGRFLIRAANSYTTNTLTLPIGLNPGASSYEVRYAAGGVVGPDGAISGPSAEAFVTTAAGTVALNPRTPGTYTVVARATAYAGGGRFYTPWSAPIHVTAVVPFDLQSVTFPDSRGPRYMIKGTLREKSLRGKVRISIARGKKKGKYRSLGTAKITRKGTFTKKFTQRRTGTYRLRYTFKKTKTSTAGKIVQRVKIRRRARFG